MEFVIEKKPPVKVKIYGREFQVKRPTVGMIESLNKQMKIADTDDGKFSVMRSFLVQLGLDEGAMGELEIDDYFGLVEFLSNPKKK